MDRTNLDNINKYYDHKGRARKRGIPFNLTRTEWFNIWEQSGKWDLRGNKRGQYVMARLGDRGAYEVGNVEIITHSQNVSDAYANGKHDVEANANRIAKHRAKGLKKVATNNSVPIKTPLGYFKTMRSAAAAYGKCTSWIQRRLDGNKQGYKRLRTVKESIE